VDLTHRKCTRDTVCNFIETPPKLLTMVFKFSFFWWVIACNSFERTISTTWGQSGDHPGATTDKWDEKRI
jgi:hypothetical protein